VLVRAPATPRARWLAGKSKGGCLPDEGGELARDGDRHHGNRLVLAQVRPALIQPALRAPRNSDHARVLALLTPAEADPDRGLEAIVVGSLDEQAAGVRGTGLRDRALTAAHIGGSLRGHDPEKA